MHPCTLEGTSYEKLQTQVASPQAMPAQITLWNPAHQLGTM